MSASHHKRPDLSGVVHVTQKICARLPRTRSKAVFRLIASAVRAGNERSGFRVCAFSVLSNHFHYLVEADSNDALARGMQGLGIRIAKALNKHWRRRGKVFRERFFARLARGRGAMRRALLYVLQNARRHGVRLPDDRPDPYSSGAWYRHWWERPSVRRDPSPVVRPRHPTLDVIVSNGIGLRELPAP